MKRLNVKDPNVFNTWRTLYYDLTNDEQETFGYDMEQAFPSQKSYTLGNYVSYFSTHPDASVVEMGGWKGELACDILKTFPVKSWLNIDYCKAALEKTSCSDKRYNVHYPPHFHWFYDTRIEDADVFIAAHVIEHLTDKDLMKLLEAISGIQTVIFEAPINMDKNNWDNYFGTHILEMGWNTINAEMQKYGYSVLEINKHCFYYELK